MGGRPGKPRERLCKIRPKFPQNTCFFLASPARVVIMSFWDTADIKGPAHKLPNFWSNICLRITSSVNQDFLTFAAFDTLITKRDFRESLKPKHGWKIIAQISMCQTPYTLHLKVTRWKKIGFNFLNRMRDQISSFQPELLYSPFQWRSMMKKITSYSTPFCTFALKQPFSLSYNPALLKRPKKVLFVIFTQLNFFIGFLWNSAKTEMSQFQ